MATSVSSLPVAASNFETPAQAISGSTSANMFAGVVQAATAAAKLSRVSKQPPPGTSASAMSGQSLLAPAASEILEIRPNRPTVENVSDILSFSTKTDMSQEAKLKALKWSASARAKVASVSTPRSPGDRTGRSTTSPIGVSIDGASDASRSISRSLELKGERVDAMPPRVLVDGDEWIEWLSAPPPEAQSSRTKRQTERSPFNKDELSE